MPGDLSNAYLIATDAEFRILSGFALSVRAGRILSILGSGQVTVELDDQDGGDATAWPLNGFTYAVGDVVYVLFANNASDSGIVVGSKAPLPVLDAAVLDTAFVKTDGSTPLTAEWDIGEDQAMRAERIEARDVEGLTIQDDGGNTGIFIEDGGQVGVGTNTPDAALHVFHANYPPLKTERNVTTNSIRSAMSVKTTTTATSGDTFGTGISFELNDAETAGQNIILDFNALRDGADNNGAFTVRLATGGSLNERFRISNDGKTGIGVSSPQGRLHVHDGSSGFLFTTVSVPDGNAITVIPNAAGDVTDRLDGFYICNPSSGTTSAGLISAAAAGGLAPGATLDLLNDGANIIQLQINANGAVSLQRTAGAKTYVVSLQLFWQ
jgi:hypothetical protein